MTLVGIVWNIFLDQPIMSIIRFTNKDKTCLGELYNGIDSMSEKIKKSKIIINVTICCH